MGAVRPNLPAAHCTQQPVYALLHLMMTEATMLTVHVPPALQSTAELQPPGSHSAKNHATWLADASSRLPDLQIIMMGSHRAVEKFAEAKRGKVSPLLRPRLTPCTAPCIQLQCCLPCCNKKGATCPN